MDNSVSPTYVNQAINWTHLSCNGMAQNEVRPQLHALAYNLGIFLQGTDLPEEMVDWSAQGDADPSQIRINPTTETINHARFVLQMPEANHCGTTRLIFTQIGSTIEQSALHLGNAASNG